jgi:hypothetical protein
MLSWDYVGARWWSERRGWKAEGVGPTGRETCRVEPTLPRPRRRNPLREYRNGFWPWWQAGGNAHPAIGSWQKRELHRGNAIKEYLLCIYKINLMGAFEWFLMEG